MSDWQQYHTAIHRYPVMSYRDHDLGIIALLSLTELPSALLMTHTSVPRSPQARCMSRKLTSADVISIVSLYIKLVPSSIMTQ